MNGLDTIRSEHGAGAGAAPIPHEETTTSVLVVSAAEKALREKLRDLVLDDTTSGIFEKDSAKALMNKQKLANVFLELCKLYLAEVGEVTGKKAAQKLNEAAMFANYAMSISPECEEAAKECISKIEIKLYAVLGATSDTKILPMVKHFKERLVAIRKHCKDKLGEIESKYEEIKLGYGEGSAEFKEAEDDPNLRAADEYEIKEVRGLYEHIAKEIKEFLAVIITECEKILGEPPCKYSVIALGSLALQQFTPYSDLEFAILIEDYSEEKKDYFRKLSQLLHFWVINLGESPIPHSKFELDLDNYISVGFSFDLGGKTPLGRPDKQYELIQMPEKMTDYLNHHKWGEKDKILPYILEVVDFICGSESLTNHYRSLAEEYFKTNHESKSKARLVESVKEAIEIGGHSIPTGDIKSHKPRIAGSDDEGRDYNAKKELYRLVDRLVYGIATYHGIIPSSVWDSVEKLKEKGIIGEEAAKNLLKAASYATKMRLGVYSYYGQQNDTMMVAKDSKIDERSPIYELDENEQLLNYYNIAIPFQLVLEKFFGESFDGSTLSSLKDEKFYENSPKIRGMIHKRFLKFEEAEKEFLQAHEKTPSDKLVIGLLGIVKTRLGKIEEAIECYRNLVKMMEGQGVKQGIVLDKLVDILPKSSHNEALGLNEGAICLKNNSPSEINSFYIRANLFYQKGDYENAMHSCQGMYNKWGVQPALINIINLMAKIYIQRIRDDKNPDYEASLKLLKEAISLSKDHPSLTETYSTCGDVYSYKSEYETAIYMYQKALLRNPSIREVITIHYSMWICSLRQSKYKNAIEFLQTSLKLYAKFNLLEVGVLQDAINLLINVGKKIKGHELKLRYFDLAMDISKSYIDLLESIQDISSHEKTLNSILELLFRIYVKHHFNNDIRKLYYKSSMQIIRVYKDKNDVKKVIELYERLNHKIKSLQVTLNLATSYDIGAFRSFNEGDAINYAALFLKAKKHFMKAITIKETKVELAIYINVYAEIGNFYVKHNLFEEAIPPLEKTIKSKNNSVDVSYDSFESIAVDDFVKHEIQRNGTVYIDAYVYAYFLLHKSLSNLGRFDDAIKVLNEFKADIEARNSLDIKETEKPKVVFHNRLLAKLLTDTGRIEEADLFEAIAVSLETLPIASPLSPTSGIVAVGAGGIAPIIQTTTAISAATSAVTTTTATVTTTAEVTLGIGGSTLSEEEMRIVGRS